jgi:uncharacterized protein
VTTLIIFHSPCCDGFTASWVAKKKFPDAEFYPQAHHKPAPDVTGKDVYVLDIAYTREKLLEMLDKATSLTVIDHHITNQKELEGLVFCKFDMLRSGAGLTWDTLFPEKSGNRPWLVNYVEDRDLWNWRLPFSREVSAALDSYPQNFETWDKLAARTPESLAAEGALLIRYENMMADRIISGAREVEFEGYKIPIVNTPVLMSEVASRLAVGKPFAIAWRQASDGKIHYSFRSTDAGIDCSLIAQKYGGGGHRNASGVISNNLLFQIA